MQAPPSRTGRHSERRVFGTRNHSVDTRPLSQRQIHYVIKYISLITAHTYLKKAKGRRAGINEKAGPCGECRECVYVLYDCLQRNVSWYLKYQTFIVWQKVVITHKSNKRTTLFSKTNNDEPVGAGRGRQSSEHLVACPASAFARADNFDTRLFIVYFPTCHLT